VLSGFLTEHYQTPERILVDALTVFDDEALEIVTVNVGVQARIPGMVFKDYKNTAYQAEEICPVSNALRGNLELRFNANNFGYGTDQPTRKHPRLSPKPRRCPPSLIRTRRQATDP
jgi:hypothetical protein